MGLQRMGSEIRAGCWEIAAKEKELEDRTASCETCSHLKRNRACKVVCSKARLTCLIFDVF